MPVDVTEAFLFEQLGRSAAAERVLMDQNGQLRAENAQLRARLEELTAAAAAEVEVEPAKVSKK